MTDSLLQLLDLLTAPSMLLLPGIWTQIQLLLGYGHNNSLSSKHRVLSAFAGSLACHHFSLERSVEGQGNLNGDLPALISGRIPDV